MMVENNYVKCFRIIPEGGKELLFTDNSEDIIVDSIVYKSNHGLESRDLSKKLDDSLNENKILGFIDNEIIKEADIISGKFNNAFIEIFSVNPDNIKDNTLLYKGYINEIQSVDNVFYATIINNKSIFEKNICEVFSPICRCQFCDKRCTLNKSDYTKRGKVVEKTNEVFFKTDNYDIIQKANNYYKYGEIKFLTGLNKGFSAEVKESSNAWITLFIKFPYSIQIGDEFEITAGCNKEFSTCCEIFNNAINFRGENDIPRTKQTYKFY